MNNHRSIWKTAFLPVIDFLMIVFGSGIVYLIRYSWFDENFDGNKRIFGNEYLGYSIFFALATVFLLAILGIYSLRARLKWLELIIKIATGVITAVSFLITFLFFNEYNKDLLNNGIPVSRFILGAGGFVIIYCVLFGRFLIIGVEKLLNVFGLYRNNIAIIGQNPKYEQLRFNLVKQLKNRASVALITEFEKLDEKTLEILEPQIRNHQISQIILVDKNSYDSTEIKLVSLCENFKVNFLFLPTISDLYNIYGTSQTMMANHLFLELKYSKLDGWWVVIKRLFDLVFSAFFLVVFSWLYFLIAIILLIQNDSPIFYLSERVGPDGKTFKMWKFARMKREFCTTETNVKALKIEQELISKQNLKEEGPLYKISNDPRNTKIGGFLEKTSLDELPQFFNVFIGNMSVVGPRPHQPREVAKYKSKDYKVLNIKPGVTGIAQINGRSDLTFNDEVELDTFYIENWKFLLDLEIIIKTPIVIMFKKHSS